MPAMDSSHWRRIGYVPAADAARAIGMPLMTLHRYMNSGAITAKRQGRYRFAEVASLVAWVRRQYTDESMAAEIVARVRLTARKKEG